MTTSSTPTLTLTLSVLYRSPIGVVEADQTGQKEGRVSVRVIAGGGGGGGDDGDGDGKVLSIKVKNLELLAYAAAAPVRPAGTPEARLHRLLRLFLGDLP